MQPPPSLCCSPPLPAPLRRPGCGITGRAGLGCCWFTSGPGSGPRQRVGPVRGGAALRCARRRLPGALPASPRRQRLPAASTTGAAGGARPRRRGTPGGSCRAVLGGRARLSPGSPPARPGRSGGRRCVPALRAEPPDLGETGPNRRLCGRNGACD